MDEELLLVNVYGLNRDSPVVNVYGLNRDSPGSYENLLKIIKFYYNHVIAVGDWNLILDPYLDYFNYKHTNNLKARERVEHMISGEKIIWNVNIILGESQIHQSKVDWIFFVVYLVWHYNTADYRSNHSNHFKTRIGQKHKTIVFGSSIALC